MSSGGQSGKMQGQQMQRPMPMNTMQRLPAPAGGQAGKGGAGGQAGKGGAGPIDYQSVAGRQRNIERQAQAALNPQLLRNAFSNDSGMGGY